MLPGDAGKTTEADECCIRRWWWLKVGIGVTAASTLSLAVGTSVFVAFVLPAAATLVENTEEVFSGLDVNELNTAVRRLVKILDVICAEPLIDCDG